MKLLWVICLCCAVAPAACGQQLFFRHHPLNEELEGASPGLVYERRDGYLWMGTNKGLLRFDGRRYQQWLAPDSLASNEVTALFEDAGGLLWVGYSNGAVFHLLKGNRLEPWLPEEGWPAHRITDITQDGAGNIWLATYGEGVYCWRNGRRLYQFGLEDGLPALDVYDMATDVHGRVLVGTDSGLSYLGWKGSQKTIRTFTRRDGLPDNIVRAILPDAYGNCWVGGYDGGVSYLEPECPPARPLKGQWPGGVVRAMQNLDDRELMVGADGDGLYRYDFNTGRWHNFCTDGLYCKAKIADLHLDAEGNLWVLSNTEGVQSAHARLAFQSTPLAGLQAICTDRRDGSLWLGDQSGLYHQRQGDTLMQAIPGLKGRNVVSLYQDEGGWLWIGTFGYGLYGFHPETRTMRHFCDDLGEGQESIFSIAGEPGRLWLATLGGVLTFNYNQATPQSAPYQCERFMPETTLGHGFVYCVYIDRQGRKWFGLDGVGVAMWDGARIQWFNRAQEVDIQSVYSIIQDGRGHIWFNTARQGLVELAGATVLKPIAHQGAMRRQEVSSLALDAAGNLLIIHREGIDVWNVASRHLVQLGAAVGIRQFDPNLNAVATDGQGHIWIGANRQLLRYTPLQSISREDPATALNGVDIYLQPAPFWEKDVYSSEENNLVFSFAGIWYTDPAAVRYYYQLRDFDHNWITTVDPKTVYSNLPSGSYQFSVVASINPAFHEIDAVNYAFRVKLPLWKRPWFILISLIALATALALLARQREQRLAREASLKRRQVESQFEALKSQINPHFLFNSFNTLAGLIEENPPAAVGYVEKLADVYRSILLYREQDLISLDEELNLAGDYMFLQRHRYGNAIRWELDLISRQGFIAPLTLQILLENAIKHNVISIQHPLIIRIRRETEDYLEVTNNFQPKLTPDSSTGFGLQSIIHRYELLSPLPVQVIPAEDAFTVRIPLIAKYGSYEDTDRRG